MGAARAASGRAAMVAAGRLHSYKLPTVLEMHKCCAFFGKPLSRFILDLRLGQSSEAHALCVCVCVLRA